MRWTIDDRMNFWGKAAIYGFYALFGFFLAFVLLVAFGIWMRTEWTKIIADASEKDILVFIAFFLITRNWNKSEKKA